jgi:hypothetical protein
VIVNTDAVDYLDVHYPIAPGTKSVVLDSSKAPRIHHYKNPENGPSGAGRRYDPKKLIKDTSLTMYRDQIADLLMFKPNENYTYSNNN